jgi:uncharacterized protein YbcI
MSLSTDGHKRERTSESNGGPPASTRVTPPEESRSGGSLLQISNSIVRLYKEAFGRGPTKARAQFAGPDTLVVILEDSMTVSERYLAAIGEHERLRDMRLFLQHALEDQLRAIVEQNLDRLTVAFIDGVDTHHDVAVAVFTLAPVASEQRPTVSARTAELE